MAKQLNQKTPRYFLKPDGIFVIENYNFTKPFANFFPGIAGEYGIPMWVFYVNRGQCIASFGIKDKDHAFLEFFPANKSWQITPNLGFRTFLKIKTKKNYALYEPFHNGFLEENFRIWNAMLISPYDLTLKEKNHNLGLDIEINYFPLPLECFAALIRTVKIKNISRKKRTIQLLDGLPSIVPYGIGNRFLKKLSRTAEAWMKTKFVGESAAFYKIDVDPADTPEVIHIQAGNFYVGSSKPIIDSEPIFGPRLNFDYPYHFFKKTDFKYPKEQAYESKTPSAFSLTEFKLSPDEEKCLYSTFGNIRCLEMLETCLPKIKNEKYILSKKIENREIITQLQKDINTESGSCEFNFYSQQTYLDNIIRGGYPIILGLKKIRRHVFYLFLRKHGDLERDYNKFHIQPTYFSQGNGNFRDIVQNRRNDLWFNPDIKEANLITFFNLIQTDGFNPLIVKGLQFHIKDKDDFKKACLKIVKAGDINKVISYFSNPFNPGSAISFIEENNLSLKVSKDKFLNILIANSIKEEDAQHKQEDDPGTGGFWTDHWTYCLELLEAYLELYPEKLSEILLEKKEFKFYDNIYVVRPRKEKYVLYENKIRQLNSVKLDTLKHDFMKHRLSQIHWVRKDCGKGKVYQTTLLTKLICLMANKLASLDPFGCGVEMEANKPNWYDALNGLPALFGSSVCETMELKRLISFLKDALPRLDIDSILIYEELYELLASLAKLFTNYLGAGKSQNKDFIFWDKSYALKERYREKTLLGISGKEKRLNKTFLSNLFDEALKKIDIGIEKSFDKRTGLYCAYFINEVIKHKFNAGVILPSKFRQRKLPLFLEAQVHALKIKKDKFFAHRLYGIIKKSHLYDTKLKMYKVTESLQDMPFEIGRCRAFSRGWLENESIWSHMQYKYLLELLRSGLYEEFYSELRNILVCFQDPKRYGRSILENSSFIVSSVFSDKRLHGSGFVARLSGSTAEFLHIWRIMNTGMNPFFLNEEGSLNLRFSPVLTGWLFNKDNTYSFNFLSSIKVVYHNPKRKNTFGKDSVSIKKIMIKNNNGTTTELRSDTIAHPIAEQIRSRLISKIDLILG